ncbi:MHS family MFS transporter [Amycolatopsis acidicola]|uniref:MHS family MFS transporter n=1 Tax=Amycolatopsis acidicola TaxID=2596893 RepID=A0A5N0VB03_9PSEU|nr:MFS transporter [Amycolatopsis acidicola]KAA9163567.1 MHS family MFS transporter [Amycolatopsis acidicola]
MTELGTDRPAVATGFPPEARAAIRGGVLAYFVDQYDIYLPIVALAPASAYFQSTGISAGAAALLNAFVFASTLIARPLGAAVFGHFADTRGRRKSTLVAVAGFGVTTALIAVLPGYETIGIASAGLLIALRFIDGIFLGGEYTTAVPLAMEWSPKRKRGLVSGSITCTSPGAYAVVAAITLILLSVMPSAGVDSAYAQWGWRIPFLVGALLAVVLFRSYQKEVEESRTERTRSGSPLAMLFKGEHRRTMAQVFVLMTGTWLATNAGIAVLPGLLKSHAGLSGQAVSVTMMIATAVTAVTYPLSGLLSQRIGRRRFFIGYGVSVIVIGGPSFALAMSLHSGPAMVVACTLVVVFTIGTFGPIAAYLTERFPASIRASGYGVGYSLALIIPAFYALYLDGISTVLPGHLAPIVLIVLAGLLISAGAAAGPETKETDMGRDTVRRSNG